jgi:hypothetical protein
MQMLEYQYDDPTGGMEPIIDLGGSYVSDRVVQM